jgi:hypothetical protein
MGAGHARADEPAPEAKKIASGQRVNFVAELGTTTDILGMGFERNLSQTDANGDTHRVYPDKSTKVAVNQYEAKFEILENSLLFDAHAHYLFAEAGVNASTSHRYMVVRVDQISQVVKLQQEGKPIGNAPMYASKIFYGWALYVVIEGDSSTFTTEVAANLIAAGAKLDTEIKNHKLTSYVHLIGLKPKNAGDIPIATTADAVREAFETSTEPQPIYVEYTLMQDAVVDAIPWKKNELLPGRYAVSVDVALMDTKADGRAWDVGSLPDPLVTLVVDGKPVTSCKQQDSMESHCIHDSVIDIDATTTVGVVVIDKDIASDDPVGSTEPLKLMSSGQQPGAAIQMKTVGQLRWAKVTLTPAP